MKKNKSFRPEPKKAYLIGIGGAGMSALATLLRDAGWAVGGSDKNVFEPTKSYLKRKGIKFHQTYRAKNIPSDVSLIVIGKNVNLAPEENAETRAAIKSGAEIKSLPETLAMLAKGKEALVVAGSYGKSTTAALLAWCLTRAGKNPSFFIGGLPLNLENSGRLDRGTDFVLEGDEYPSSNTDSRSKFLHLDPKCVLLISAEHDHVNVFPTENSYVATYKKLVGKIPTGGLLVYAKSAKNTKKLAKFAKCRSLSYGVDDARADWYARNIKYGPKTTFELMRKQRKIIKIETSLFGKHNIENVVGAAALLLTEQKVSPSEFAKAVASFRGIKRRIELLNPKGKIPVYEGFGSSYQKTRAIFEALHLHFPKKRLVVVFEPHAFSWRNKIFLPWYKKIFNGAGEVIMLPAVSRGTPASGQLDTETIWKEAQKHFPIKTVRTEHEALTTLKKIVTKDDIVVLVSSGPILGLAKSVPKLF